MPAGVGAVGDDTVDQFGNAIDDPDKRKDNAETGIGDAIFGGQGRHGKGKILADEVKHGVAYHRTDDDAPLPVSKGFVCFHFLSFLRVLRSVGRPIHRAG